MNELSFEEVARKYPDFPRTVMRKIDTAVRGVVPTEKALERAREEGALYACPAREVPAGKTSHRFSPLKRDLRSGISDKPVLLFGAVFRDGTWVLGLETFFQWLPSRFIRRGSPSRSDASAEQGNPYILDVVDGKLWLLDESEPVEEVYFVPTPKYYGKKTSRGTPMSEVVTARFPNTLTITVLHCYFFEREKIPCKFCVYAAGAPLSLCREESHTPESLEDIYETVNEALKEEERWTSIYLVGGSDPRGNLPYEKEVEEDLKVLKTLQRCFGTLAGQAEKIPAVNRNGSPSHQTVQGSLPVQVIASAFPKEQLLRLKEAGLSAYTSNIEVWDEKLFQWVCPGKAKYFGRQYWIECILSAVEIFGRGNVSTQLVAGAELAKPYGFKTIEEALESSLEGVEFFARYGVHTSFVTLWIGEGSVFYREKQELPPLEYFVRLAKGINEIRRKYKLSVNFNDYRHWPNFPDMDLARLDLSPTR